MTAPVNPTHLDVDQLGDYVDGLLAPARARAAAEHLAVCDRCAARLHALRALLARAAASPASIEPPRDLWPAVRARIAGAAAAPRAERRRWGGGASLAAAAAVLVVVGASAATVRLWPSAEPAPVASATPVPAPGPQPHYARVDAEYARAAAHLDATVRGERGALAPATLAAVERGLRTIDDAIAEARDALARDPHNAALVEMLSVSYQQKLALLKRTAALPSQL